MDAPLDISPWFVLAGTIVPAMDPTIMTLNNATNPAIITWQQMKVRMAVLPTCMMDVVHFCLCM